MEIKEPAEIDDGLFQDDQPYSSLHEKYRQFFFCFPLTRNECRSACKKINIGAQKWVIQRVK